MLPKKQIQDRIPIWLALSKLYLDTELNTSDLQKIACIFNQSSYTFETIRTIDKKEVFPVLKYNMKSPAGEWGGFNEKWLIKEITNYLDKNCFFKSFGYNKVNQKQWKKIENFYHEIQKIPPSMRS